MAVEASRAGAEPIATAAYPVAASLNRVAAEFLCDALTGLGIDHGVTTARVWDASRFIDDHVTSQMPAMPIPPRIALRTALNRIPVGLVGEVDARLRAADATDRLDEVLEELGRVREDCGMPPLAQPIGGILAGQAVRHVLSARRWADASAEMRLLLGGGYGSPPMEISDEAAAFADRDGTAEEPPDMDDLKARAGGAPSEEDLLLLALFGDEAARLIEALRGRGAVSERDSDSMEPTQSERVRELIRMVEESDVGELTLQDGPLRITVRRHDDRPAASAPLPAAAPAAAAEEPEVSSSIRLESPMVGTFYRSPSPSQPSFVDEGDRVEVGQTLCILEAMKLFNEFKAEHAGVIRKILVANAEPVEYGQPLFELEPA
jgi:oxaloacetate decarboxylase alpha subunit